MTTASVTEFKANVSTYLRQVEAGEEVVITNHGKIQARIVPEKPTPADGRAFLAAAEAMRKRLSGRKDDWSLKECIAYGRR
jgi:prevent-host-death family protein